MSGQHHDPGDGRFHQTPPPRPQSPPPSPHPRQGPPGPRQGPPHPQPSRIPVPQPTAAEQQQAREQRKREAKRRHREAQKEAEVPVWGRDALRALSYSAAGAVLAWVLILLVRWRILQDNRYETVDNTELWAAIVAMLVPLMLPFVLMAPKRPDLGFRYGTVPFLPVVAVMAGAVQGLSLLVWPWLVGDDLVPGTVLAELASDPIALVTATALVFTWTCVFLMVVATMMESSLRMRWVMVLVLILPFLAAIFGAMLTSVRTFEGTPSMTACVVWVGAGIVALVVLTAVDALRNLLRRRSERT